jgi:hypothetical protein
MPPRLPKVNRGALRRVDPARSGCRRRRAKEPDLIRHIVFFTARHAEDIHGMIADLRRLGGIRGVGRFEVTRNRKVDQLGNDIDIVVYAEFPSEAALRTYKADPIYAEVTRAVRPLREMRFAADVEADAGEAALRQSA